MAALTIGSFVFFTGLVGLGTWLLTRHDRHDSSDGYFLAGRSLTGGFIAGSLLLTNLSTEQLVGLNGAAFMDGLCVMAWEVVAGMSLVLMALYFLPRYLRSGIATIPEFLERRYDPSTRSITAIIFILAYALILLPIILYSGAVGLMSILDLPTLLGIPSQTTVLWLTVWLIGVIGSIYAIFGGLRTVAVSDTLNGFGLLAGGILISVLGLAYLGTAEGGGIDLGNTFAGLERLTEAHPEKFDSLGGPESSVPFSTLFTGVLLLNLFYWCTNQQIIQRTFGASSLAEGQKGVLLAGVFKILAPLILVLPGIIAYGLYADGRLEIPEKLVDGAMVVSNDQAYGTLVRRVLPTWLAGFFAAVMVGAILSSFNSALNSTVTLFSLNVYRGMVRPAADDREVIRVGKGFGIVIALAAMVGAPFLIGQDSIFAYLQKMNGLYFIPIFSVVLLGLLDRRVPAFAANIALVVGFVVIALGYFVPQLATIVADLHEFHFLGIVFASLIATMLILRALNPRPTPWAEDRQAPIDMTPWKFAWPVGIGLVVVVMTIYALLAR